MLQGDTKSRWNDEPFQMFEGGAWWIPPELPFIDEVYFFFEFETKKITALQVFRGSSI